MKNQGFGEKVDEIILVHSFSYCLFKVRTIPVVFSRAFFGECLWCRGFMKTFDKKREKSKTCRPGQHSFGILSESTELGFFSSFWNLVHFFFE